MAVIIPNLADASHDAQAFPNAIDIDILSDGLSGNGVLNGCEVTAQGSPNMTVHVAAGTRAVPGGSATVAVSDPAISAASAHPRRDLVVVDAAGTVSVVAGTPEPIVPADPTIVPVLPSIPAGSIAIASVDVPGGASAITNAEILDKRAVVVSAQSLTTMNLIARKTADEGPVTSTTVQNDNHLFTPTIAANEIWILEWRVLIVSGDGQFKCGFTFPSGTLAGTSSGIAGDRQVGGSSSPTTPATVESNSAAFGTVHYIKCLFTNGGTPGAVQWQWASVAGSGVTVKANSTLWAVKLA